MKIRRHLGNLEDTHRGRQNIIHRLLKILRRDGRLRDKCHNLRQCVHSRIGAPRSLRQYLFSGDASNRRGQCPLHGHRVGLHLPTCEIRSVIRKDHFEIAHAIFRVLCHVPIIQFRVVPAIYQVRLTSAESHLLFRSDILVGFRRASLSIPQFGSNAIREPNVRNPSGRWNRKGRFYPSFEEPSTASLRTNA